MWNLEGKRVVGKYMGTFVVQGIVELSRVQYGGEVAHHIQLDHHIEVYGAVRKRVILDHKYIEPVIEVCNHTIDVE